MNRSRSHISSVDLLLCKHFRKPLFCADFCGSVYTLQKNGGWFLCFCKNKRSLVNRGLRCSFDFFGNLLFTAGVVTSVWMGMFRDFVALCKCKLSNLQKWFKVLLSNLYVTFKTSAAKITEFQRQDLKSGMIRPRNVIYEVSKVVYMTLLLKVACKLFYFVKIVFDYFELMKSEPENLKSEPDDISEGVSFQTWTITCHVNWWPPYPLTFFKSILF